jgi:hypothetical protein
MTDALAFLVATQLDRAARELREQEQPLQADAELLLAWLRKLEAPATGKVLAQRAPLPLRDKARREAALAVLLQRGKVRRQQRGRATIVVPV